MEYIDSADYISEEDASFIDTPSDKPFLYKKESFAIRGAIYEVYRQKGCGFHESIYQECLAIEFGLRGIPFIAQPELKISYKGHVLHQTYRPDFICYDLIIVELKALSNTVTEHEAQVLNYLKATSKRLGLLVNFGCHPLAKVQRIAL